LARKNKHASGTSRFGKSTPAYFRYTIALGA
jgi:hypothetical protein